MCQDASKRCSTNATEDLINKVYYILETLYKFRLGNFQFYNQEYTNLAKYLYIFFKQL